MGPVLDGVGFAHQRGLVHRDIKPPNILLHSERDTVTPKIADFGIAKSLDAKQGQTATGMALGTMRFMAPEQIRDSKRVDQRVDIYALGMTLYAMAALKYPFEGESQAIIYKTMCEIPPLASKFNSKISAPLDRLLDRTLAKEPEQRFQNCAQFAYALALALQDADKNFSSQPPDALELHNGLFNLPEEDSIYNNPCEPMSPTLLQPLFSNVQEILELQSYIVEDTPEFLARRQSTTHKPQPSGRKQEQQENVVGQVPLEYMNTELDLSESKTVAYQSDNPLLAPRRRLRGVWIIAVLCAIILAATGFGLNYFGFIDLGFMSGNKPQLPDNKPEVTVTGCAPDIKVSCYSGQENTLGQGICKAGYQLCRDGALGPCEGEVLPRQEICNDQDDNCNGKVDENFPDKGQACVAEEGDCRLEGQWVCAPNQDKLQCKVLPDSKQNQLHLRIVIDPPDRAFTIRYAKISRSINKNYCIPSRNRGMRVSIRRKGFYTCSFRLPPKQSSIKLKMRPVAKDNLDPSMNYCLQP
jgi:hypothetical protein